MMKSNAFHICGLLAAMQREALTARDLMEITGLDRETVYRWLRELHVQRLVHVERWDQCSRGRYIIAAYRLGKDKDARRTYADRTQRQRDWRARQKHIEMVQMTAGAMA
jgi:DNA-binding IclR family transcriptional regulator